MAVKRDATDDAFSKFIRWRDNWTCQRCGQRFLPNDGGIDCSHFISRIHRATRWCPLNACAHCKACHKYLGERPIEFAEWIKEKYGEAHYWAIKRRGAATAKWPKHEIKELRKGLREWVGEYETN